jgi:hypothetical protein
MANTLFYFEAGKVQHTLPTLLNQVSKKELMICPNFVWNGRPSATDVCNYTPTLIAHGNNAILRVADATDVAWRGKSMQ